MGPALTATTPSRGARQRGDAIALDEADPLAHFRDRFVFADDLLYLDGNSLGRLPKSTAGRLRRVIEDEWGAALIRSWDDWIEWPRRVGDALGEHVVGAAAGQVVVADSTTVNLYKLAAGALAMAPSERPVIVTDAANFPTDRYVFERLGPVRRVDEVSPAAVEEACRPGDVSLVSFSHVAYRSGELSDAAAVTAAAHDAGALVLWDLSHSAGSVPVRLDDWDVDFATGCTYKYLNSGPGAPAFAYVSRRHQGTFRQPIWGWVGQRDPFEMGPAYDPDTGVGQFLSGTPAILGIAAVDEGVRLIGEAGVDALRAKGVAMTQMVIDLADDWLGPHGFTVGTPRDPTRRGSHVSLVHPDADAVCRMLIDRCAVVPDYRRPDVVRLGPAPMYTRFVDVWDAMDRLRTAIDAGWLDEGTPR